MLCDVLIKAGTILDPASGMSGKFDIAITKGKIAGIYAPGQTLQAEVVVDAERCIVVPGLIDVHTHVFHGHTEHGIQADTVGVKQGVTTVVDAGSSGIRDFSSFITDVVEKSETRVLSWLNVASAGLCSNRTELMDLSGIEPERTTEFIQANEIVRGLKVRMSSSVLGASGIKPLEIAKEIAVNAKVPLMVHIGNGPPELSDILALLDAGDVVTHAFHGKKGGILTDEKELIPAAQKALARGVLFDVGHGKASFSFETARAAKAAGVKPFTISTDLYLGNYHGPVCSLVDTLAKFMALGFSLEEVIHAATAAPAVMLRLSDQLGQIAVGRAADLSILKVVEGEYEFVDSENERLSGRQLLVPQYSIYSGKIWSCL